jgi:hypothetical protein
MKLAMAITTKDRVHCAKRAIEPLLQPDKFDLHWIDGSADDSEGREYYILNQPNRWYPIITGGPDAAIVYALTKMLEQRSDRESYTHIGLCEQDVLLHQDWFGPTLALFERGQAEGLEVGAVSARCYEDRILVQRDGYALMHNLGAGHIIFTRHAARVVLDNYRTTWSTDNRLIFCQLSGIDIGAYWAFRGNEQHLTADWGFDAILARHGLVSLALTPSLATMLDQDIAAQGLKMAPADAGRACNDGAFKLFEDRTRAIRWGDQMPGIHGRLQYANSAYTIFPHQILGIGGKYSGDWRLKWAQGFGPFVWESGNIEEYYAGHGNVGEEYPHLEVPILGPCEILIGGSGRARVTDTHSGYSIESSPADAGGGILQVPVPSGVSYRTIRLEALTPGVGFYGVRTREPQPWLTGYRFDYSCLPKVE